MSGLDAYWRFFTTFNTREPSEFASALNFPHVRVSPRRAPVIVASPAEHAERQTWQPFIDAGWDHTTGREPTLLHESADRAHIVGGWTRYTADEKPIVTNHVCYIATKVGEQWGIQSRFGVDGDASEANYDTAVAVVERYMDAIGAGDWSAAASLSNYPTLSIGIGEVDEWTTAAEHADALARQSPVEIVERKLQAVMGGDNGVNVAIEFRLAGGASGSALVCVTQLDGHWGIQGRSIMLA